MSALAYTIRDVCGDDITDKNNPPRTFAAAKRVARFSGQGTVVLGARGQIMYRVDYPKKKSSSSPKRPRV